LVFSQGEPPTERFQIWTLRKKRERMQQQCLPMQKQKTMQTMLFQF
jgi:hypothetical protein